MQSYTEFEFNPPPTGYTVPPGTSTAEVENAFPEPTGPFRLVSGIFLAEEVEENAQDGVEVENRDFAIADDPATPDFHEGQIGMPSAVAFQDNGVYNIGVRPTREDVMRGGTDPFGWPLSLAALAMKNLAGNDGLPCVGAGCYEPCDDSSDAARPGGCALPNFDPAAACPAAPVWHSPTAWPHPPP